MIEIVIESTDTESHWVCGMKHLRIVFYILNIVVIVFAIFNAY